MTPVTPGPKELSPMKAMRKRLRSEKSIQEALRLKLFRAGFTLVEKTHGNKYQKGWPDLMAFHPDQGVIWIEVKRPSGRLTPAQRGRFPKWGDAGLSIWVLDSEDINPLGGPPNWHEWL